MDPPSIALFVEHQKEKGASASTVAGYFWACKSALMFWTDHKTQSLPQSEAALLGWTIEHALKRVRLPRVQKGKRARMVLGLEQETIDQVVRKTTPYRAAIIEFLNYTGLRVSEMCRLRLTELRPFSAEKTFIRVLGKGSKERSVWIPESLLVRIRRIFGGHVWLFESRNHLPLDPDNVYHMVADAFWSGAQIRITPHNLRHLLATRLLRDGADPREVGDYLGHSSPAVTLESYDVNRITTEKLKHAHHGKKGQKRPKDPKESQEEARD